jgi:hypothetical protein
MVATGSDPFDQETETDKDPDEWGLNAGIVIGILIAIDGGEPVDPFDQETETDKDPDEWG